jgi:hypothetical protein
LGAYQRPPLRRFKLLGCSIKVGNNVVGGLSEQGKMMKRTNTNSSSRKPSKSQVIALLVIAVVGLSAMIAAGCSPTAPASAPSKSSDNGSNNAAGSDSDIVEAVYDWSMQSDCAVCHTNEGSNPTDGKHPQATAHEALNCTICHTDEQQLQKSHDGIKLSDKPASKPSVITVAESTCVSCHGDLQKVSELTATSEALKDDKGLIVNPHSRPDGETHAQNPATCTSCHNNHSEALARDAKKYCASCHHRGVWQCGTCHEKR